MNSGVPIIKTVQNVLDIFRYNNIMSIKPISPADIITKMSAPHEKFIEAINTILEDRILKTTPAIITEQEIVDTAVALVSQSRDLVFVEATIYSNQWLDQIVPIYRSAGWDVQRNRMRYTYYYFVFHSTLLQS